VPPSTPSGISQSLWVLKMSSPSLLTNLQVQERQSHVCSTVAIAIVAEICGPFTCIPAILDEYRAAGLNVPTGCLKALTFIFKYIGPSRRTTATRAVTMLEDALTDRDLVHSQTTSVIVKHIALGVTGMGCEDSTMHLMNLSVTHQPTATKKYTPVQTSRSLLSYVCALPPPSLRKVVQGTSSTELLLEYGGTYLERTCYPQRGFSIKSRPLFHYFRHDGLLYGWKIMNQLS
jgi:hypothetical protein